MIFALLLLATPPDVTAAPPRLPPVPVSAYEPAGPQKPPPKPGRKKRSFGMETGLAYDYSRLGDSSFQGLSWSFGFFKPGGPGFVYGMSYAFDEGSTRWDMRFRVGATWNWTDAPDLVWFVRVGYSFNIIALPQDYITSRSEQTQHGWFAAAGLRYRLYGQLYLYGEIESLDYYASGKPGDWGILPSERGFTLTAGLTFHFRL